jgi:hypothetical protein
MSNPEGGGTPPEKFDRGQEMEPLAQLTAYWVLT